VSDCFRLENRCCTESLVDEISKCDFVIADPPYGISLSNHNTESSKTGKRTSTKSYSIAGDGDGSLGQAVVDECHRSPAKTWATVLAWAGRSRVLGLSATPSRLDGRGLDAHYDELVFGPSMAWLIQNGCLSKYRAFAPSVPNLKGVHTRAGDYALDELNAEIDWEFDDNDFSVVSVEPCQPRKP